MASSVVDAALIAVGSVAAAEIALHLGVESDLEVIKSELELMQTHLEAKDEERSQQDPVARVWARQVRDVAYDVEDCVDDFTIHLGRSSSSSSCRWWRRRRRWWCSVSRILARRRIAGDMKKLRARVDDVFKRRKLYLHVPMTTAASLTTAAEPAAGSSASTPWSVLQEAHTTNIGRHVVGDLKTPSGVLRLSNLMARRDISSLMIVSICASATATATATANTLIGMAYDDLAAVTGRFRCRAWVTVPHPFNLAEFIRSLLRQFLANDADAQEGGDVAVDALESIETMGLPQLVRSLSENLEHKTVLLVIDDVSTREEWDSIKLYFRPGVKNSSRIIVTSQREDVAKYCAGGGGRNCSCLCVSSDTSAFCNYMDLVEDESAAAVNSDLGCMRATLESLYNNLPHHVKYCFMYLSIFQEDFNIKQRRLVQRWIVEGYLKGVRGSELEEVGERVFNDFLNMTIIQPTMNATVTNSARITSCSVNPLMLGFSMSKAMEEKLVCMLDHYHSMAASEDTIRHVVVRRTWRRDQEHQYKSMDLSRIRSLTVFGEWRSFFLRHKMRMLRVLDLEGVEGLTGKELEHIGVFQHLKYLGLRSTQVEHLPRSLGNLRCLEILDIRNTNVRSLPSVIENLMSLHVLLGGYSDHAHVSGGDLWGLEISKVIGELRALNTLGIISVEHQGRVVIQKLTNLTKLRKLSVTGITDENGPDLCSTLEHLSSLQSLTARSDEPNGLSQSLQASSLLSSSLQRLQVLKLHGRLVTLPEWILGLRYLFKLYLHNTRLQGPGLSDTIDGLAHMPSLTTLLLLENSIMCSELVLDRHVFVELELLELSNLGALSFLSFRAAAMPNLKMLQVDGCNNLEKISVVAGAMPKLETLQIENCNGLRSLSYEGAGIEMPMLKNFQVAGCNNLQLLPFVAGDMPYLYTLLIRHCSNLEVFIEPHAVPKLKMLQIDGCRKLHWLRLGVPAAVGLGISFQTGAMPDLKELQLSGCHGLGRLSFGCGAMPRLETLRIEGCANLLNLSFEAGATPKLEKFQIDGCSELMELSGLQHLNLKG